MVSVALSVENEYDEIIFFTSEWKGRVGVTVSKRQNLERGCVASKENPERVDRASLQDCHDKLTRWRCSELFGGGLPVRSSLP